jgi:hypothetical protein
MSIAWLAISRRKFCCKVEKALVHVTIILLMRFLFFFSMEINQVLKMMRFLIEVL